MLQSLTKLALLLVAIFQTIQFNAAVPTNLTPTDPVELNKIAFQPLLNLYGNVGPMIYNLLTDRNALGEQIAQVSELIVDNVGLSNYSKDMDLIFSNMLNPEISQKVLSLYEQIKDVHVEGTSGRSLQDAVEIITNILNDKDAVDEINNIIKTTPV